MLPALEWKNDRLVMIDQRKLPLKEIYLEYRDHNGVARAIETMVVRGAPAIGVAAAYGVALGMMGLVSADALDRRFAAVYRRLERTRPTARNLFWALERMKRTFEESWNLPLPALKRRCSTRPGPSSARTSRPTRLSAATAAPSSGTAGPC